jgi:hypothetical protein
MASIPDIVQIRQAVDIFMHLGYPADECSFARSS